LAGQALAYVMAEAEVLCLFYDFASNIVFVDGNIGPNTEVQVGYVVLGVIGS